MRLLIDCCSIGYKIAYGMPALSYNGDNTHIIFGFLKQILNLAEKFKTNQFIFAWDSRQSYRKEFFPGYKKRDADPAKQALIDDARRQFNLLCKEVLPEMGFRNVFLFSGYEADDLIAWLCYRKPDDYIIVSGDEDLYQLLMDGRFYSTKIYDIKKEKVITAKDFKEKYGLDPMAWAKVKGLAGCTSDKVPGIPGVGIATAVKYLNGILKDGNLKDKIESPEGKKIFGDCLHLTALPFPGDRPIVIEEIEDDEFYSLDFRDVFQKYGCDSFISGDHFEEWREAFKLIAGRV